MFNSKLLAENVQTFINAHLKANIEDLALKGSPFLDIETPQLLEQIQAKIKCVKKLPTWFHAQNIYYPSKINIEQTSSEISALYKSKLVEGQYLLDLTGGFGVDSFYFSKKIKSVTHCEIDAKLSEIVQHNFKSLKVKNIATVAQNGLSYLEQKEQHFDWVYVDPSRRDAQKNKRFFIEDCIPNVAKYLELFLSKSKNIMVKLSPMLDIHAALESLPQTKEIHVVAIKNEVKELLFILERGYNDEPTLKAVNLNTNQPDFKFKISTENNTKVSYSIPSEYLYEPNAAVLKAGAFKYIASKFDVKKLAQHTHLYTATKQIKDFPGKIYRIKQVLPYHKKKLRPLLNGQKANVKTRNFAESIPRLKKEFNISDGGTMFFFFTKTEQKKWVLICEKI